MGLRLKIVSPEKTVFSGEVDSVAVPGSKGAFVILKDHAPLISTLQEGVVEYGTQAGKSQLAIKAGFVEVQKNVVNLCVEV
ncbi:MAG: ATP synthase F1 subunit epsilon [Prevotella sp.]|nr:ATP synthase F1 subunit epsilon [Prevotella sp.]MDD7045809.1 ATP synthase F1 subunit epsilon [Prevotella sp.]MDY5546575.1 ATP synthase F1 subunit epsilon [Prevotella sp.]